MAKVTTTKKLKEIKNKIDAVYETGKLPKGMSLSDFRHIEHCFDVLSEKGQYETIITNVKNFYEQNNIPIRCKTISYVIG